MEKLTLAELRNKAKEKGISGYSKMKKQERIDILSKKKSKKKSSEKGNNLQKRIDELDKMFDQIIQMEDVDSGLKSEFDKILSKPIRKLISQLIKAYDEKVEMEELEEMENKVKEKMEKALELLNHSLEKADLNKINRIKSDISFITSFISFVYGFNFSKSLTNKSLKKNTQKVKEFLDEIYDYEQKLDNEEITLDEMENNLKQIVAVVVNDSTEYVEKTKESLNKLFTSMKPDLELFNMKNEYKIIKDDLDILNEKLNKLDELPLKELAEINRMAISLDNDISNTIDKLNDKIRKTREDELNQLQRRIEEFKQQAQMDYQRKTAELTAPIMDKAKKGIEAVAKESGYKYVLDTSAGNVLYSEASDDVLMAVKKKLDAMPAAVIPGANNNTGGVKPAPTGGVKPAPKGK